MLEGESRHMGYIEVIDQLAIDESQRLRREVQILKVQKNKMEALRIEIDKIKASMMESFSELMSK